MIALGGCQIDGFQVAEKKSFLQVFSELSGKEYQYKSPHFEMRDTNRLQRILDLKKPSVALIQLGNESFEISLKEIFNRKENDGSAATAISLPALSQKQSRKPKKLIPLHYLGNLINPFLLWTIERRNYRHLQALKKTINEHSQTTFIILSPMPFASRGRNKMNKLAGKWLKKMFGSLPNVRYIDLVRLFPARQDLNQDASYQAARHRVLAKTIAHYYKTIHQSESYLQAV